MKLVSSRGSRSANNRKAEQRRASSSPVHITITPDLQQTQEHQDVPHKPVQISVEQIKSQSTAERDFAAQRSAPQDTTAHQATQKHPQPQDTAARSSLQLRPERPYAPTAQGMPAAQSAPQQRPERPYAPSAQSMPTAQSSPQQRPDKSHASPTYDAPQKQAPRLRDPGAPKSHVRLIPAHQMPAPQQSEPKSTTQQAVPQLPALSAEQLVALQRAAQQRQAGEQGTTKQITQPIPMPKPAPQAVPQRRPEQAEPQKKAQQETVPQTAAQRKAAKRAAIKKARRRKLAVILTVLFFLSAAATAVWYYWWVTYATFDFRLQPIVILEGESVTPEDFFAPSAEMNEVTAVFLTPRFDPRPAAGRHTIPLTLTLGLRTLDTSATLYVLSTIDQISTEFTAEHPALDPMDFIANADITRNVPFDVRFTEEPLLLADYPVGQHTLHLTMNGAAFEVMLYVEDTTPPTATAVAKTILIGEEVSPEDFVTDIFDASPIESITFVDEIDSHPRRDQIVEVAVEDIYGNRVIVAAALTVQINQEPPVIEGTATIESLIGNPIMYRQGVTAHDDFGRELEFEVDSSGVDQHTAGMYSATYWVEDFTGLRSEIVVTVHVLNIDPEEVNQRVDEILSSILSEGMTQREQAQAIFNWVRRNLSYAASRGGPQSAYEGAYRALRDRRGNCYIYYSISEVMLTRAGIPNMRIQRIPGTPTTHLWNLINPDGLGWHHFDSLPTRFGFNPQMYYFTASQAASYSKILAEVHGSPNFYTYDPELYPEIVQ